MTEMSEPLAIKLNGEISCINIRDFLDRFIHADCTPKGSHYNIDFSFPALSTLTQPVSQL